MTDEDPVRRIVRSREIPDKLIESLRRAPHVNEADITRLGDALYRTAQPLTSHEIDVLRAIGDGGLSHGEAATVLGISIHTVRDHIKAAKAKTRAKTTLQAVARAIRQDLI